MELFEIYKSLWKRAQDDGAFVHYYTWLFSEDTPSLRHDPTGATGWFEANADIEDGQPIIRIYRLECDDDSCTPSPARGTAGAHLPAPDLHDELITLAHEYGHLRSFLGATARADWDRQNRASRQRADIFRRVMDESHDETGLVIGDRVRSALQVELTDDQRNRLIQEETVAWAEGRAALEQLGLTDFVRYDARKDQGLHAHRYKLGMDEAWPGDLEEALLTE